MDLNFYANSLLYSNIIFKYSKYILKILTNPDILKKCYNSNLPNKFKFYDVSSLLIGVAKNSSACLDDPN